MGTRSLTRVIPRQEGVAYDKGHLMPEKSLINIYKQYDGYPKWLGVKIALLLENIKVVNSLDLNAKMFKMAKGAECLAAQLIFYLKQQPGDVYLYERDTKDVGEEYIYTIYPKPNEPTYMSVYDAFAEEVLFVGTADKFLGKYNKEHHTFDYI